MPRRKEDESREGQEVIPVRDKGTEVGINLNTIFTALVLAGILWVGNTLESIKTTLNENAVAFTAVRVTVDNVKEELVKHEAAYEELRRDVAKHIANKEVHYQGIWGKNK